MDMISLAQELQENSYPGRGIIWAVPRTEPRRWQLTLSWEEARTAVTVSSWRTARASVPRLSILPS